MIECKNCGSLVAVERYCYNCGHSLQQERITMPTVIHEVLHTYTHFEKGFLFMVKELAIRPGMVQKKYLDGVRARSQKPFPLFVICGTICALVLYLTNKPYNDASEQYFYRHYYVILQALLLPLYALFTWLFFFKSKMFYAEILVLTVYMVGFMLLIIIPINIFHFAFNTATISFAEMILLGGYNVWTNLNFFKEKRKWLVVTKSLLNIFICYFLFQFTAEAWMRIIH